VTAGGSCFQTTDKCQSWNRIVIPKSTKLESLTFLSPSSGWICGYNGSILHTFDGGKTWIDQSWPDTIVIFFDIEMINKDTGLAIGMRPVPENKLASIAIKTYDGGKNWIELDPMGMGYSEIRYSKPNHKLYFMSLGRMNYSTDGAKNWESNATIEGPPTRTFSIHGHTGIMAGMKGNLAYSNDSGKTWFKQDTQFKQHFVSSCMVNSYDGLVGGMDGFMLATSNGGRTWQQETLPVAFFIMDMYAIADRVYAVGGGGLMAYKQLVKIKN
jgi:photosystem II stability/assembly factor-like uncharacterized protein